MRTNSKQRLFEVMGRVDETFKPRLFESDELFDYFINTWSKDDNTINTIKGNKYLMDKYGKYLDFSVIEWQQMPEEELQRIFKEWDVDYKNVERQTSANPLTRRY